MPGKLSCHHTPGVRACSPMYCPCPWGPCVPVTWCGLLINAAGVSAMPVVMPRPGGAVMP
eukprot:scaffold248400_cov37-Cyclotella_meneghiniana.AAC.4